MFTAENLSNQVKVVLELEVPLWLLKCEGTVQPVPTTWLRFICLPRWRGITGSPKQGKNVNSSRHFLFARLFVSFSMIRMVLMIPPPGLLAVIVKKAWCFYTHHLKFREQCWKSAKRLSLRLHSRWWCIVFSGRPWQSPRRRGGRTHRDHRKRWADLTEITDAFSPDCLPDCPLSICLPPSCSPSHSPPEYVLQHFLQIRHPCLPRFLSVGVPSFLPAPKWRGVPYFSWAPLSKEGELVNPPASQKTSVHILLLIILLALFHSWY